MIKDKNIKINEGQLSRIVKESVTRVLHEASDNTLRMEDWFDVNSLSKKAVLSITNDLRAFLQGQGYGSDLSSDGTFIVQEVVGVTMPIKQLRSELKSIGFKQWQIKSRILYNKVRVVILYADIAQNTKIIENKMLSCGWTKSSVSSPMIIHGVPLRIIGFDPKEQKSLTKEARRYKYLYHWTPYNNVSSILKSGIEARSENDFLSYPPKAHLMKGDIPKTEASKLGWMLYNKKGSLRNGRYTLIRVSMEKVPKNIEFYGDPRFQYGYFTKYTIPPQSLEVFGEIIFNDKYNYGGEQIKVIATNDTMTP